MFEKEIAIGQKYVRSAGRHSDYQIVDTEGNNYLCSRGLGVFAGVQ